jgi:hypothetical protein
VLSAMLLSMNAKAIPVSSKGETTPLETSPTSKPLTKTFMPGARSRLEPSLIPWSLRGVPVARASLMVSLPLKDLVLLMTHPRPAAIGDKFSSSSCPYRGNPASTRKVSREPRPQAATPELRRAFQSASA